MKGKAGAFLTLGIGGLLVLAGLGVKFLFLPDQAQFPDDVDTVRRYEGTLEVMLDTEALAANDFANLFLSDVPVTVDRHVTTEDAEGGKALVREYATLNAPTGDTLQTSDDWYTIDRKTMEHIDNWAGDPNVLERSGLVVGFPIGTEKTDYVGWSDDYQDTVTLEFVEEQEHEGVDTYHFRSSSAERAEADKLIQDPTLLAMFPTAIPKDLVTQLAPLLAPEVAAQLGTFLPMLPDPVEFVYTYDYETRYWVDPATGVVVDYAKDETRSIALETPLGVRSVAPVWALDYTQTDASIAEALDDAADGRNKLRLWGTLVPFGAMGLGALLLLGGGYLLMRRRGSVAEPS